jgi:dihydrofolate synthase/folylpolyglutamate synthase
MLEKIYQQAGYHVGCYSSPHLVRYNERVRVDGCEVSDNDLCAAFKAVDAARLMNEAPIPLTYFEVGTLAAMWHFVQIGVEVAILEVGLGGRLDAVNAFEPSCAVVTSVDLDHQEFLGNTRESIGFEKAGIYRSSISAICGDANPPASLVAYAHEIHADLMCLHRDFDFLLSANDWQYTAYGKTLHSLPLPALQGKYQLNNAACAIAAITSLQSRLPVDSTAIKNAMLLVSLAGRFQTLSRFSTTPYTPWVILDVAHNPHAAKALAENLQAIKAQQTKGHPGRTFAVFAMLADKDIKGVIEAVKDEIDGWYVADIHHVRGALAKDLAEIITRVIPNVSVKIFNSADYAYQQACIDIEACMEVNENDKIIVFGSFFTVSAIMQFLSNK